MRRPAGSTRSSARRRAAIISLTGDELPRLMPELADTHPERHALLSQGASQAAVGAHCPRHQPRAVPLGGGGRGDAGMGGAGVPGPIRRRGGRAAVDDHLRAHPRRSRRRPGTRRSKGPPAPRPPSNARPARDPRDPGPRRRRRPGGGALRAFAMVGREQGHRRRPDVQRQCPE